MEEFLEGLSVVDGDSGIDLVEMEIGFLGIVGEDRGILEEILLIFMDEEEMDEFFF